MFTLKEFKLPANFRGKSAVYVQIWWMVQSTLFRLSPQFMYRWRVWLLRKFGAAIGIGVIIRPSVRITYPWKLKIGDYSWIGDNVELYTLGVIEIGHNCVISQRSYICTGSHDYSKKTFDIYQKPIYIGNSCWLATDVFVGPGVRMEDSCIVGARSSVYKSLKGNSVYRGNPVVHIRYLKDDIINNEV